MGASNSCFLTGLGDADFTGVTSCVASTAGVAAFLLRAGAGGDGNAAPLAGVGWKVSTSTSYEKSASSRAADEERGADLHQDNAEINSCAHASAWFLRVNRKDKRESCDGTRTDFLEAERAG